MKFIAFAVFALAAWAQPPAIAPDGIVDAASLMLPSLPFGKLAPGSKVRIPGVRLSDAGSETVIQASAGNWHASFRPESSSSTLLEATLPHDTPIGKVQIRVATGQGTSRPQEISVARTQPSIFTSNDKGWGPVTRDPVHSGERVSLRVNGLNGERPKLFVGGKPANVQAIQPDQLTFTVPNDAPQGCWTPVWMEAASGALSNFATLAITNSAGPCEDASGWPLRPTTPGRRTALVTVQRIATDLELRIGYPLRAVYESAAASFFRAGPGDVLRQQMLPPAGTCTAFSRMFLFADLRFYERILSLRDFLGGSKDPIDPGAAQVFPDSDQSTVRDLPLTDNAERAAQLGGTSMLATLPLFLNPGKYVLAAGGAGGLAAIPFRFEVAAPFESDVSPVTEVERNRGLVVHWRDVAPGRQMALIALSADPWTGAAGVAVCLAQARDSEMRIPPYALANLPATRPQSNQPFRFLILVSMPASADIAIPEWLDEVRSAFLDIQIKTVTFR